MKIFKLDKRPDFAVPGVKDLARLCRVGMHVKLRGGGDHKEDFWVKITGEDGIKRVGRVDDRLVHADGRHKPQHGDTIIFRLDEVFDSPILWPPIGMRICEIQICGMFDTDEESTLADSMDPPQEPTSWDVLVRYCDFFDDPNEPDDILYFEDFNFEKFEDALFMGDYLSELYTDGVEPEVI